MRLYSSVCLWWVRKLLTIRLQLSLQQQQECWELSIWSIFVGWKKITSNQMKSYTHHKTSLVYLFLEIHGHLFSCSYNGTSSSFFFLKKSLFVSQGLFDELITCTLRWLIPLSSILAICWTQTYKVIRIKENAIYIIGIKQPYLIFNYKDNFYSDSWNE